MPLIAGRYRLGELLGAGGMGKVWLARDEVLQRDVAVKEVLIPHDVQAHDRNVVHRRTLREARAAARLGHPNVVQVFDVLDVDGRAWIVMAYVPSRSLHEVLKSSGPLEPRRVARIGLDLLAALRAAHAAGVDHRDVKPANVLLADDGRVLLTDFGIATIEGDSQISTSDVLIGSPEYMSPERARHGTAGMKSDLWSLGATLYAAVEGHSPFHRTSALATLTALAADEPDPPTQAGPLEPVLRGLLRKDPQDRINATETEHLLREAASGAYGHALVPEAATTESLPATPKPTDQLPVRDTPAPAAPAAAAPAPAVAAPAVAAPAAAAPASAAPAPAAQAAEAPASAAPVLAAQAAEAPGSAAPAVAEAPASAAPAAEAPATAAAASTSAEPAAAVSTSAAPAATAPTSAAPAPVAPSAPTPAAARAAATPAAAAPAAAPAPAAPAPAAPAAAPPGGVAAAASAGRRTPVADRAAPIEPPPPFVPPQRSPSPGEAPPRPRGRAIPAAPDTEQRPAASPARRWLLIAAAVVALIGGAVFWGVTRSGSDGEPDTNAGAPAASAPGEPSSDPGQASSGSSTSPETSAAATATSPAAPPPTGDDDGGGTGSGAGLPGLPDGWRDYRDRTGFAVYVPEGWTRSREGSIVYFRDSSTNRVLGIDQTKKPVANPVADWQGKSEYRVSRGDFPSYREIHIRETDYFRKAADWEFTFTRNGVRQHVNNRGVITSDKQAYGFYWQTRDADWSRYRDDLQLVFDSFRPAS
ncbi:serine/threonine-protein kinase [Paractinoplanes maris]|uniref:serine/threonine-protein kinase n=1 Tax=Paractinoplanes maris TaxID=1734446 RepID=UPI002021E86D|nr:serine/threonine-protein kinase [Actinoplanes maris]